MESPQIKEVSDCSLSVCPACGVRIQKTDKEEKVLFSYGGSGTRERLAARVCYFAKKEGCINKRRLNLTDKDCYGLQEEIKSRREDKEYLNWARQIAPDNE